MWDFLKELFSYKGRWNRLKFWLYPLAITIPSIIIILIIASTFALNSLNHYRGDAIDAQIRNNESMILTLQEFMVEDNIWDYSGEIEVLENEIKSLREEKNSIDSTNSDFPIIYLIILGILYVLIIYINIVSNIKRFHDLWKSGWYTLLVFVPFVNLFVFIWIAFFRGTQGPNMYGPDPLWSLHNQSTGTTTPSSVYDDL